MATTGTMYRAVVLLGLTAGACSGGGGDGDDGGDDAPATCYDGRADLAPVARAFEGSFGIATDQEHVYWKASGDDAIMRVPIAAGESEFLESVPCGGLIDVAGGHIYWVICPTPDTRAIMRRAVDGGEPILATPEDVSVWDYAVTDAGLFWSSETGFHRVGHGSSESSLLTDRADGFTTDGETICWFHAPNTGTGTEISCASLAAPTQTTLVYSFTPDPQEGAFLWDRTVDDGAVYWIEQRGAMYLLKSVSALGGPVTELKTVGRASDLRAHDDRLYWLELPSESQPRDLYMLPKAGGSVVPVLSRVEAYTVDRCHLYWFTEAELGYTLMRQPR